MKFISVTLIMLLLATGCATIIKGKDQHIGINSNPDSAEIRIRDEKGVVVFNGKTPTSVTLLKGDGYFHGKDYTVEIVKDGYAKRVIEVKSSAGGWYMLGNLVFGGLIGWFIVDPLTGAMWTLSPESVTAVLDKEQPGSAKLSPNEIYVVLLSDVPENLRPHMVPVQ